MKPAGRESINTACCVQETQGGLIGKEKMDFIVLPASIRIQAVASRHQTEYSRLWPHIRKLRDDLGYRGVGNLVDVLKRFEGELDQFVAEFELVPNQIGAVILIGDNIVGVERAPTVEFWTRLWVPLVRVCYGALALKARMKLGNQLPAHRTGLDVRTKSLDGIREALNEAKAKVEGITEAAVRGVSSTLLTAADQADDELLGYKVVTVASPQLSGQLVAKSRSKVSYASLCASGA
jgi:hypothetical protein